MHDAMLSCQWSKLISKDSKYLGILKKYIYFFSVYQNVCP